MINKLFWKAVFHSCSYQKEHSLPYHGIKERAAMKRGENLDPITSLTPREREVFQLLLRGMKAKEIACELSITPSGVNYFVKRIYKKLQVKSRVELIIRYYDLRQPQG